MLRSQMSSLSPNRSKTSYGIKGSNAHSKRKSDHNPNAQGVVQGLDLTDNPAHGVDNRKLAQALLDSRNRRISMRSPMAESAPAPTDLRLGSGGNIPVPTRIAIMSISRWLMPPSSMTTLRHGAYQQASMYRRPWLANL
jgi:hypothetical protein